MGFFYLIAQFAQFTDEDIAIKRPEEFQILIEAMVFNRALFAIRLLGVEACDRYTKKVYTPEDIDAIMEGK